MHFILQVLDIRSTILGHFLRQIVQMSRAKHYEAYAQANGLSFTQASEDILASTMRLPTEYFLLK